MCSAAASLVTLCVDVDVRLFRFFVGRIDAGEVFEFTRASFAVGPFSSRPSATSSGVSMNTSTNSPGAIVARAARRSLRKGEMKTANTINPRRSSVWRLRWRGDVLNAANVVEAQVFV